MAKIRSIAEIAGKWAEVTPRREAFYKAGVEKPLRIWEEQTVAAADAYSSGVTAAVAEGRFAKGVARVGQAKWASGTLEKGVKMGRWREGVAVAKDEYHKGFAPFVDTIAATVLPARGPKGDPRNIERVAAIASALHAKRLELLR